MAELQKELTFEWAKSHIIALHQEWMSNSLVWQANDIEMYRGFSSWCVERHRQSGARSLFNDVLSQLFPDKEKRELNGLTLYSGIRFVSGGYNAEDKELMAFLRKSYQPPKTRSIFITMRFELNEREAIIEFCGNTSYEQAEKMAREQLSL